MSVEDAIAEIEAVAEEDRLAAKRKRLELTLLEVLKAEQWGQVPDGTTRALLDAFKEAGVL